MEFVPFEAGIEVSGAGMMAAHDGFGAFTLLASQILLGEGIGKDRGDGTAEIDPKGWYSFDSYMRAYKRIATEVGPSVLENVGSAMVSRAQFPPTIVDVPSAMGAMDVAYHMNHRKSGEIMFNPQTGQMTEGIGHYRMVITPGQKSLTMICENPYPCRFDLGLLRGMAKRFDPTAVVQHDDTKPCRQRGAGSCVYKVTWK